MILYANVIPKQLTKIPWPWKNETRDGKTFVSWSPGKIEMPSLLEHFDWNNFVVEDMNTMQDFGTRNFKSIFTTASRFLGYEKLLVEKPDLSPILDGFLLWNKRLLYSWGNVLDWFHIADDLAGNNGLMMSPDDFHDWLLPVYRRMITWAKDMKLKVIFHSDGDISEILDILVDLGISALNFQPVGKMEQLKDAFSFRGVILVPNEEDEQNRTNEETMRLQR